MTKADSLKVIDEQANIFTQVSDKVWEYAELSLKEYQSMALYCKVLEENGFAVEKGIHNVPTAFKATFGKGKPTIGILAEYDALSGLSQAAGGTVKQELIPGGSGHGCGHNVLGAGSLAAAFAIKEYLKDHEGTVILYGCPGEEGGAGKAFMARDKEFYNLDAAFSWHPGDVNSVRSGSCNASIQIQYTYSGIAAHAGGTPHLGRSALDAVELMNIGVQFLREHMGDSDRVHYAITDAGGLSPNVVQAKAKVLYMIRSDSVKKALALVDRVDKIAEAAAMMTETTFARQFIDGTADLVPNNTLEHLLYDKLCEVGVPQYTEEEWNYAKALVQSYENPQPGIPAKDLCETPEICEYIKKRSNNGEKALNDFLVPYAPSKVVSRGSTDVGDVSWQTPTAQLGTVVFTSKALGHSWQNVSAANSSIAHKGLLCAGKVLALAAMELYENPKLLQAAKAEFQEKAKDGYTCPIPPDAQPVAI